LFSIPRQIRQWPTPRLLGSDIASSTVGPAAAVTSREPLVNVDIVAERTEVLRILAEWDPGRFGGEYGEHLLAEMHSRPSATGPAREALTLARGLSDAVLSVRILREVACRRLADRPAEALAMLDEAIAAGPLLEEGAAEEAETHRLRAQCLWLLGRQAEDVDASQREAELKLGYAGGAFPFQRLLAIEDVLWDSGRIDAALALVDKAVDAMADGRDAAGMLRLRPAERASELLRDAEALEDLAVVTERHPLLAARCQAAYGLVHWRAQRRDEAIAALDESLALNDGQPYARQMRGGFRQMLGTSPRHWTICSPSRDSGPNGGRRGPRCRRRTCCCATARRPSAKVTSPWTWSRTKRPHTGRTGWRCWRPATVVRRSTNWTPPRGGRAAGSRRWVAQHRRVAATGPHGGPCPAPPVRHAASRWGLLRCGISRHAEPAGHVRQIAWASSVNAAATRSAGRASTPSS
jgi:tetratricopeptide (TPR) repeat protein